MRFGEQGDWTKEELTTFWKVMVGTGVSAPATPCGVAELRALPSSFCS